MQRESGEEREAASKRGARVARGARTFDADPDGLFQLLPLLLRDDLKIVALLAGHLGRWGEQGRGLGVWPEAPQAGLHYEIGFYDFLPISFDGGHTRRRGWVR